MYKLSKRSRSRMKHVHPDLILVVGLAIRYTEVDFSVLEGARTLETQKKYVLRGASRTLKSRHLLNREGVCHAIDLGAYVGGSIKWHMPLYEKISAAMKRAAAELGIPIEWGGDWTSFKDGPHFQLPESIYK